MCRRREQGRGLKFCCRAHSAVCYAPCALRYTNLKGAKFGKDSNHRGQRHHARGHGGDHREDGA